MLKHTTPRSSPNLGFISPSISNGNSTQNSLKIENELIHSPPKSSQSLVPKNPAYGSFNERSVDCDGIVSREPLIKKSSSNSGKIFESLFESKLLKFGSGSGSGIGPVITHGKAIVRRGLSFNGKKDFDAVSIRSVKSEGQCVMRPESQNVDPPTKITDKVTFESEKIPIESARDFPNDLAIVNSNTASKDEIDYKDEAIIKSVSLNSDKCDKGATNQSHSSKKVFCLTKSSHPSLKSLLRLPGVYGHIPVPEGAATGSPHILNPDSLSLNSADSFVSSNSGRTSSRSWDSTASSNSNNTSDSCNSNASTSSTELTSTTLKVYSKCLRSDIEYKTVNIGSQVTSKQLINLLLSKARMRHRDSNLFYLTMEVTVRRWSGVPVRALLVLEDSARPAQLALCHPSGDLRFVLQMRRGGVVKIHDTVLMPGSQYKSLLISYCTNAEETVQLLLNCCGKRESKHYFALHEVCQMPIYKDRRLISSERPLEVKAEWPKDRKAEFVFVLRRNMSQALSLRKLSTLSLEMKPGGNKWNYIGKPSASIPNSANNERNLILKSSEYNSILSNGRMRGRSLSPVRPQSNLEETAIDCTCSTPVIIKMKGQRMHSDSEALKLSSCSCNFTNNNTSTTNEENNIQRMSEVKTDETKIVEKFVSKYDTPNSINCNRMIDARTQFMTPQQCATLNSTNSMAIARKSSTTFVAKNTKYFNRQPNFITSSHKLSTDLNTQQDITNNEKLSSLAKIQQEKFAKALEKLNPHLNDSESDNCWSKEKELQNIFQTHFTIPDKCSVNLYADLPLKDLTSIENQTCLNKSEFLTTNSDYEKRSFWHIKSSSKSSMLSSAVQTELTCIPSKGFKNQRHKWNSVETLMDSQAPLCQDAIAIKFSKNSVQENNNVQVTVKDDRAAHQPGVQCEYNCKKCFYI